MKRSSCLVLVLIIGSFGFSFSAQSADNTVLTEKIEVLFEAPKEWSTFLESATPSPDSKHISMVATKKGKIFAVVLDGKILKEYDSIGKDTPVFSPDSQHMAYKAKKGGKWMVVLDSKEGKPYDNMTTPMFSADSKRLIYIAVDNKKQFVVLDGKESGRYDIVPKKYNPVFSPDSKRYAFLAKKGKSVVIVVDGVEGKEYDGCVFPDFQPGLKTCRLSCQER